MGPRIQFDFSSFDRRTLIIIIGGVLVIVGVVVGLVILFGGGEEGEQPVAETTPVATRTLTPTLPMSPTPSQPGPPTDTPTPAATATLEPYQYTVQAGDTLYYIIQLFGYRELVVVPEILSLNDMANEADLYAGQILLIPRQTPTPGPTSTLHPTTLPQTTEVAGGGEGEEMVTLPAPAAPGASGDYSGCGPDNRCVSPDGQYWIHEIVEGDTVAGLAWAYYSRVDAILQANDLDPDPILSIGDPIYVPILITSTPTLTPTGGPDSTATPTPTPGPPSLLAPTDDSTIPRNQRVVLQWAAVQPLSGDQYYLVIVQNTATEEEFRATTRSNAYRLPSDLQPGPGHSIEYQWRVAIISGSNPNAPPVGGQSRAWTFTWGS
jgi:LysM repeat protein